MRINRYIARCGIASRRKSEELILSGSVFVNGVKITNLAFSVAPEKDIVEVNGETINLPDHKYYVLNKPRGYTVTRGDIHAEKTIYELLPKDTTLFSVGRLDRETTGLILITNDGDLNQNVIHPSKKIEKEYKVILRKPISDEDVKKLEDGVVLEDGLAKAKRASKNKETEIVIIVEEGRNRLIRRMIGAVGNQVEELERIRIGDIKTDIAEGQFREMSEEEVAPYV